MKPGFKDYQMPSKHKVGLDRTGKGGHTKRGWRSGLPNSWQANMQYQRDIRAGLIRNFPDRINRMSNGAWQFFFMPDDEWFEKDVPKPEPGESPKHWADRTGVWDNPPPMPAWIREDIDLKRKEQRDV